MGSEPTPGNRPEHRPAHILLHGTRAPTPEEIREHADIDAEPSEVYEYRQTRAAERQADAVGKEAYYTEMVVEGLFLLGAIAVLWEIVDGAISTVRY